MSEQFEHKVHELLGDFELEPCSDVWQKVQQEIQPEKKKRRFIFWWLLPVVLAGGALTYYFIGNGLDGSIAKPDKTKSVSGINDPVAEMKKSETVKPSISVGIVEENREEVIPSLIINKKQYSNITTDKKEKKKKSKKDIADTDVTQSNSISTSKTSVGDDSSTTTNSITKKPSKGVIDTTTIIAKSEPKKELVTPKEEIKDTSVATVTISVKNEMKPKKWRFGITTNIGVANVAASGITDPTARFNNITSLPMASGSSIPSKQQQNTIAGVQYGLGVNVQRQISRNLDLSTAFGYQYQSFAVKDVFYKDSANMRITTYSSTSTLRTYSINLSLAANWYFFNTVQNKTGLSFAIDNMYLVAAENYVASVTYGVADFQKSNSLSGYNKWQPYLRAGLVSNFITNQNQLVQLSPYLRYGLRSYSQQRTGNNHLWQLGLHINYYFK